MKEKIYTIRTTKCRTRGEDRVTQWTGTIDYLVNRVFGYTLECGASWNKKINRRPTTIKSLITNLQKSYEEIEASCYDRTYVEEVKNVQA